MTSKLYLIATPIGNLDDITLRAQKMLREITVFFVEDTREFYKLMQLLGIPIEGRKVFSYAAHNMKESNLRALQFLESGVEVGFASDRGTPGISDPGARLVAEARELGIAVIPIPGVSSVTALASVSGLHDPKFVFLGFLHSSEKERMRILLPLAELEMPTIFFESPQRIRETARWFIEKFPGVQLFMGREMTKIHEAYFWFESVDSLPELGEYAVMAKFSPVIKEATNHIEEAIRLRLLPEKAWAKEVGLQWGVASKEVYNHLQRAKTGSYI